MHRPLRLLIFITFLFGLTTCNSSPNPTIPSEATATSDSPQDTPIPAKETVSPTDLPSPTDVPTTTSIPATPTNEPVTLLGVEPDQLNGVTVRFWHGFSGARERLLIEWAEAFTTENTFGIKIEVVNQENLFKSIQDGIRAGTPPNLTIAFTNQATAWDQSGAPPGDSVIDLSPYVADPVYGYAPDELADFYPAFIEQETFNGKLLGFPTYRSAQVMFYNVTWAQELGFQSPPTTPEEFKAQACTSSQARGDGTGGWFINTDTATTLSWIFAFGGNILSSEGEYLFNTPETAAAFSFIKDLSDSECAWKPEETFPNAEFATRQGLFYSSSLSGLFFQQQAFEEAEATDEWTMIPFPSPTGQPITHIFGPAYNVFKTTPEEQLAAWLFMQWASSPANQARWTNISGSYPTRASTIEFLNDYVAGLPQWTRAYDWVPGGKNEPGLASWGTVRWVVSDAAAELFGFGFTADQIPSVLQELDRTANEVAE